MSEGITNRFSRRHFVKSATVAAAAASAFPYVVRGAESDKEIKVGLIGCGGRGCGAAENVMKAAPNVRIVAVADVQKHKMDDAKKSFKDKGFDVAEANWFLGMDGYKKVLAMDEVNYVILATPPYFRPEHFEAAVNAGKHVFMEKPVAVDPVGIRSIIATGEKAKAKKLSVVAGTQRRHQKGYIETIKKIQDGEIGKILAAQAYWCGGGLWYHFREEGEGDMEWMLRDWVNWTWLSGDHIVEQHVHNLDVINWVLGKLPEKAIAMGSRQRRKTGNQYDNFAVDFFYPEHIHVLSMCRQIDGCGGDVSERVVGAKGVSNCNGWISTLGKIDIESPNPYEQEHADLIAAIRSDQPVNEAKQVAESTMCAIMARTSAYTGKEVTWKEMMESDMRLAPPDQPLTPEYIKSLVPVPGVVQK